MTIHPLDKEIFRLSRTIEHKSKTQLSQDDGPETPDFVRALVSSYLLAQEQPRRSSDKTPRLKICYSVSRKMRSSYARIPHMKVWQHAIDLVDAKDEIFQTSIRLAFIGYLIDVLDFIEA